MTRISAMRNNGCLAGVFNKLKQCDHSLPGHLIYCQEEL